MALNSLVSLPDKLAHFNTSLQGSLCKCLHLSERQWSLEGAFLNPRKNIQKEVQAEELSGLSSACIRNSYVLYSVLLSLLGVGYAVR